MKYTIKSTHLIRLTVDFDGIFETKQEAQKVADYLASIDKKHLFEVATMEEERQDRIQWYEKRLQTVIKMWGGSSNGREYIEQAQKDLEEVKNGRDW